jgi:hypothetical protein
VTATLTVEQDGQSPQTLSLASGVATDSAWFDLAGYDTLGYFATPTAIALNINGPGAGVDPCVADMELRPVTVE